MKASKRDPAVARYVKGVGRLSWRTEDDSAKSAGVVRTINFREGIKDEARRTEVTIAPAYVDDRWRGGIVLDRATCVRQGQSRAQGWSTGRLQRKSRQESPPLRQTHRLPSGLPRHAHQRQLTLAEGNRGRRRGLGPSSRRDSLRSGHTLLHQSDSSESRSSDVVCLPWKPQGGQE